MKRDMELCRKILFKIEEEYIDSAIMNLEISGYTTEQIAYHCKLLKEVGFVSSYNVKYADDQIWFFSVGALTWEGHDFLDKIRSETVWNKTKEVIIGKGLPFVLDVVKEVAQSVISSMTEGAVKAILNQ